MVIPIVNTHQIESNLTVASVPESTSIVVVGSIVGSMEGSVLGSMVGSKVGKGDVLSGDMVAKESVLGSTVVVDTEGKGVGSREGCIMGE